MLRDLVLKNRSYRRFYEDERIEYDKLLGLVDLARNAPSTVNSQALKFKIIDSPEDCAKMFPCLSWAGRLDPSGTPKEGERPSAYILIMCDQTLAKEKKHDEGIAAQTIMLGATELGYGGCMIGSVKKEQAAKAFNIDGDRYSIDLVLALGKPKENVILTTVKEDGNVDYYRDEKGNHYVPKRKIEDIII